MARLSQIRWIRSDYARLSRAVTDFNKKINQLQAEENKLYLPEIQKYQEIKGKILTRNELNQIIKSLRKFTESGQEELIMTETGEELTKWEYNELQRRKNIIQRRLQKEIKELEELTDTGYSKAQMGSSEYKAKQARLNYLKNLEQQGKLKSSKEQIYKQGRSDYELWKAIIYKKNYLSMLKQSYSNYEDFELLYDYLDDISNPLDFYEFIEDNEFLKDITLMYDANMNIAISGYTGEDMFNMLLDKLNIK